MTKSSLVSYTALSPNHYWGRKGFSVDTITPHYMGGNCSVETCGSIFAPTSRQASSNYGIGSDGRIALYVDEDNGPWTSGSWRNDCRAITFEIANLVDGSITNAAWRSLVALCVDICKRYGFKGVQYTGNADHSQQRDGYMLLTMHKWFQSTDCPGSWLSTQFGRLAAEVNEIMGSGGGIDVKPANNAHGGKLDVDGIGGYNTIIDLQHALGTHEDGEVSWQWHGNQEWHWGFSAFNYDYDDDGSPMVRRMQRRLKVEIDGHWGHDTSKALQEHLIKRGYSCGDNGADGSFGPCSVKALQQCLNDGNL